VTLLGVDGLELDAAAPLLGVPGRERGLMTDPGRLTGVIGREVFDPRPSLMMEAMEVLWACPVLTGRELLTLLGTGLSGSAGWEVEDPAELEVGVGSSGSSLAPSPSNFEIWSLIAVLNASALELSFVPSSFGFGLNSCIGVSEGVTDPSTEAEAARVTSVNCAASSSLFAGETRERS
jgi:hypothetical protein